MAEKLTQIELDSIQLHETKPRSLTRELSGFISQEDDIETALGTVKVMVQGDRSRPAIFTYHDIGLNSITCFQGFFNGEEMMPILRHFCVYHINAPGQQEGSLPLPQGHPAPHFHHHHGPKYLYPTMDQLAEMIVPVMQWYNVKTFIGFGTGAGANVLARFALAHQDKVEALVLINCTSNKAGWTEWGYQKVNSWHLRSGTVSPAVEEYLLWHWFGKKTVADNIDLVHVYSEYVKAVNPQNLAHFIESYIKRTDLGIIREVNPSKKALARMIRCPVMLIAGDTSPHLDDTVNMNSRMDPENCQWMKFQCGGMVMEECPDRLAEAFRLFVQGMGYVPSLSQVKLTAMKAAHSKSAMLNGGSQMSMGAAGHQAPMTHAPEQTVC